MFNSVAFDVVVSMVFIYLFYSLLATILGEMISSWFGIRGKLLKRAVERMLTDGGDDPEAVGFKDRIGLFFNRIGRSSAHHCKRFIKGKSDESVCSLSEKFYEYPGVKYLTEGRKIFRSDKPSYFSRDTFAQTLLHLLSEKGAGNSDIEKISFSLKFNTPRIQPKTLKYLQNLLKDSNSDGNVFSDNLKIWFDQTMQRTTGWYKRKMRGILFAIGFFIAVANNIDSLAIFGIVSKDDHARDKLVELSLAAVKDSAHYNLRLTDSAGGSSLLDTSLFLVKKDIDQANSVMGLHWKFQPALADEKYNGELPNTIKTYGVLDSILKLNCVIDTLKIKVKLGWGNSDSLKVRLAAAEKARQSDIELVNEECNKNFTHVDKVEYKKSGNQNEEKPKPDGKPRPPEFYGKVPPAVIKYRVLDSICATYPAADSIAIMISLCRGNVEKSKKDLEKKNLARKSGLAYINSCLPIKFVDIDSFSIHSTDGKVAIYGKTNPAVSSGAAGKSAINPFHPNDPKNQQTKDGYTAPTDSSKIAVLHTGSKDSCVIYGKKSKNWIVKNLTYLWYVVQQSATTHFWGFLLTALMVSCGAPFWFGLLQKLMALRGAGVKPEEITPEDGAEDSTLLLKSPEAGGARSLDNGADAPDSNAQPEKTPMETSKEMVETALRIYGDDLRKENNVVSVFQGYLKRPDDADVKACVQVNVINADTAIRIRDKYRELKVSEQDSAPLNVVVTGKPRIRACVPDGFTISDRAIANKALANGWGSYGCLVRDDIGRQTYVLSCYHVMNGGYDWEEFAQSSDGEAVINDKSVEISNSFAGYFSEYLDVAIAVINNHELITSYQGIQETPAQYSEISEMDVFSTKVRIAGAASGNISGTIVHNSKSEEFEYPLNAKGTKKLRHRLSDLIAISHVNDDNSVDAVTREGDSGALVIDEDGKAVGIVVAGDDHYTYAIKMSRILSTLSLQLGVA